MSRIIFEEFARKEHAAMGQARWRRSMVTILLMAVGGALQGSTAAAQNLCYALVNATGGNVSVNFRYPGNIVPENGVYRLDMIPNGRYTMCFNPGTSATAFLSTGTWENFSGALIMGHTNFAAGPGEYRIVAQRAGLTKPALRMLASNKQNTARGEGTVH